MSKQNQTKDIKQTHLMAIYSFIIVGVIIITVLTT